MYTVYCVIDAFIVIADTEEDIIRADIDVELRLTGIDADVNWVGIIVFHSIRFLMLVIRARGPHDYSS